MDSDVLKKSLLSENNGHVTELLKVAEEEEEDARSVEVVSGEMVQCPECGKDIPEDAEKCPHCGVEFEFEFEEMFECPMCGSVLEITVTKCPSCGTEFEDAPAEEPAPSEEPAKPGDAKPLHAKPPEEPAKPAPSEEPAKPASFVDRLKQVKEDAGTAPSEPAVPEPKKELSFAERMKAIKEGALPKEPETPVPDKPAAKAPAASPSLSDRVKTLQKDAPGKEPPKAGKPPPADTKSDQYKELPRHIGEVKRLLVLAKELNVDVSTSKAIINKAVTAGKSRDMDTAIRLVKEGKEGIERELKSLYTSKFRTLESALVLEKKAGKDVSNMERALAEAKGSLEADDFQIASEALKGLEERMMKTSSSKLSQAEMHTVSKAIENADYLKLDVTEAKSFFEEAKIAAAKNDTNKSIHLIKQASNSLHKVLPTFIAGEMRKAKVALREIKMMNVDITSPVQMLKVANDHVAQGDYCSALEHIRSFKEFVQKAAP